MIQTQGLEEKAVNLLLDRPSWLDVLLCGYRRAWFVRKSGKSMRLSGRLRLLKSALGPFIILLLTFALASFAGAETSPKPPSAQGSGTAPSTEVEPGSGAKPSPEAEQPNADAPTAMPEPNPKAGQKDSETAPIEPGPQILI